MPRGIYPRTKKSPARKAAAKREAKGATLVVAKAEGKRIPYDGVHEYLAASKITELEREIRKLRAHVSWLLDQLAGD